MVQQFVWLVSIAAMALVGVGFLFASRSRGREEDFPALQARAYRLRGRLFWILALVLTPVMIGTLFFLPYPKSASAGNSGAVQVVQVNGQMWVWLLDKNTVVQGQPVEFRVNSKDVNHGFGIYDPDMALVAQVQAMPGHENVLRHTFTRPGTYKILCLEYCGTAHHGMAGSFTVSAQ